MRNDWDLQEILLKVFILPIYFVIQGIKGLFSLLWRFTKDVIENIYKKIVLVAGTVVLALLVAGLFHLFKLK